MKKTITSLSLCLIAGLSFAQTFKVDTILYSGPIANRTNLVILGDGYTSSEQAKFLTDAKSVYTKFMQTIPYTQYKNYFNVFAVEVISAQSGASHAANSSDNQCAGQPAATVNNYFGSAFDCGTASYHRLLCATKNSAITSVLAANTPFYDQALIIVNSTYYGGAGGQFAVSSMASAASEIAIHEVGHSFANLADEYWAGSVYATDTKPNMTSNGNSSTVKWKIWNGVATVGVYPHSGDPKWFKPTTNNCKMEVLGLLFCPVCYEAHIEKVHGLVTPYDSYTPANSTTLQITTTDIPFSVKGVLPIPNTLKIQWLLNGTPVKGNSPTYTVQAASINGTNQLQARLIDTTLLVRASNHLTQHVYLINWNLQKSLSGITVNSSTSEILYTIFGNPLTPESYLQYTLNEKTKVQLSLVDMNGKIVIIENEERINGTYQTSLNPKKYGLAAGTYALNMIQNGVNVMQEKIVVE